ncbi:MAG TPA: phosphoenolpyruvate-utilizing N-terminal domain-containing protein, partial [Thermomicrobiaceae bacterium]|nr:phosphoenolpyruvate-utilizing N-terminal domain-containing protein [Thermomicrobiaceae bacterium]
MTERRLRGTGAAPGVAIGPVARYAPAAVAVEQQPIAPEAVAAELTRLHAAVERARERITAARAAAAARAGEAEAAIFDAHLLMLDDPALIGESERRIRAERLPAAAAVAATAADLAALFAEIEDAYLRERKADV